MFNRIEKESKEIKEEDETVGEKQTDGLSGGCAMTVVDCSTVKGMLLFLKIKFICTNCYFMKND